MNMDDRDEIKERLEAKTLRTPTCWLWLGAKNDKGYGQLKVSRKTTYVHRLAVLLSGRELPEGMVIDHLCRNSSCLRPDHLEVVSVWENTLRGNAFSARHARKTHCSKGHPLAGPNLYVVVTPRQTARRCKTCEHERRRRYPRYDSPSERRQ